MNIKDCTHCAYDESSHTVIDMLHPVTGRLMYSGETIEDCKARYPGVAVWEFDKAYDHKVNSFISGPVEITEETFQEMLNILPPVNWVNYGDSESFKMCEMTCGNITGIFARVGNKYYQLSDRVSLKHDDIVKKIKESIK